MRSGPGTRSGPYSFAHARLRPRRLHLSAASRAPVPAREVPARTAGRGDAPRRRDRERPGGHRERARRRSRGRLPRPGRVRRADSAGDARARTSVVARARRASPPLRRRHAPRSRSSARGRPRPPTSAAGPTTPSPAPDAASASSTTSSARRARCARRDGCAASLVDRPRRPPGRRHERGARGRPRRLHPLGQRLRQLPVPARSRRPRPRPARRDRRRAATSRRSRGSCPRPSSEHGPSSASTSPAPTPIAGDRLGRLALTQARPRASATGSSATRSRAAGVPVCLTLAGGYADPIEDTVGDST